MPLYGVLGTHVPGYNLSAAAIPNLVPVLTPGVPIVLFNAEAITSGQSSMQVSLHRRDSLPHVVSIEFFFSGDPGAFDLEFQTADTDTDAAYVTKDTVNSGLNAGFFGRFEVTDIVATFFRLKAVGIANGVNLTATAR